MKKILNSIMLLLLGGTSFLMVSCKDDDNGSSTNTNREFMTMFICDNTRGKGTEADGAGSAHAVRPYFVKIQKPVIRHVPLLFLVPRYYNRR